MYRWYIYNQLAVKAFLDADNKESGLDGENKPFNIQTSYQSRVASGIYRQLITEPLFSVEAKRYALRLASIEWHAFLQILLVIKKKPYRGTQAAVARKKAIEEKYCW